MKKYAIYNYMIFYDINNIYIRIIIESNMLNFTIYRDGELLEESYCNYTCKCNDIYFKDNIFSDSKIIYKDIINLNIIKTKKTFTNYVGVINGLNLNGKIYIEKEKYFKKPINYIKFISVDINKKCFYSITNIKWLYKELNRIYCNINDNLIKDNHFIKSSLDTNVLRIKTYQFNYELSYDFIKNSANTNRTYNFIDSKTNFTVSKMFDKAIIQQHDTNALIISNIF